MAILTASDIGQSFGADDIFSDISVNLEAKDRVGLVGPNGIGKTTLLLILSGLMRPTTGQVHRRRGLTLGYLRQEAVLTFAGQENTVYEEMLTVFADVRRMEMDLRRMEAEMAAGEMGEDLLERYGRTQEQYELSGGYAYQHEIKRVLLGLGFPQEEWQTPLTHLSGGQKTRLLLGRLLLEQPDLLILDEPTNHLDVNAIEWLEGTLRRWEGALIIVSHDRYFLNKIVTHIWEMRRDGVKSYRGDYTAYVRQRRLDWEHEMALFTSEKERMEQELDFIRKNIAGGKSDMAKGKLRRLTRDIVLIEEVGVLGMQGKSWMHLGERVRTFSANEAAQRLRQLRPPDNRPPPLRIKLRSEERSGRVVLRGKNLNVGYEGETLFTTDKLMLERLDCAALIGPNGSGKTTFLRMLMGEAPLLSGTLTWGENVQVGYFAQGHEQLVLERRVIDEIMAHKNITEGDARNYLAQYLFRGDDVFKRVGDLSGGERGRLALAILALEGANFLLLDEPTNHLDIPSQEILQEVLERFDGTILMVSHDRYLVDRLATQIWALRDGHLHVFEGSYAAYLEARAGEELRLREEEEEKPEPSILDMPAPDVDEMRAWVSELTAVSPETTPPAPEPDDPDWQTRVGQLDEELAEAEALLIDLQYERSEANAAQDPEWIAQVEREMTAVQTQLEQLSAEWEQLMEAEE